MQKSLRLLVLAAAIGLSLRAHAQSPSCEQISKSTDDFSGEVTLRTDPLQPTAIIKITAKNGRANYFARLSAGGLTVVVGGKGAHVLFTDGTRWYRSADIDAGYTSSGFVYTAFIRLSAADLKLFSTKTIAKFKLYIFEHELDPQFRDAFLEDAKCIAAM